MNSPTRTCRALHRCLVPIAFCLACALVVFAAPCAAASGPPIVGASSGEHLWFVIEEPRTGREQLPRLYRLYHHAAAMPGPMLTSASLVPALAQYPEAMAAWESQLWIVNEAQPNHSEPRREVFSLRVHHEATFEVYQHEPRDRLQSVEPLPAHGKLAGFVARASGAVALLVPTERGTSSVVPSDGVRPSENELSKPRLLALKNGDWEELPLPDDLAAGASLRLGADQSGDGSLCLFAASSQRGDASAALYRLQPDGWVRTTILLNLASLRSLTSTLGQCTAVLEDRADGSASLLIARPNGALPIAQFAAPETPWTVLGLAGDVRLITRGAGNQIFMERIDPISGALGERAAFITLRPSTMSLMHLPLMLFLAIVAVSVSYVIGKSREQPLQLPAGWVVLGPVGRVMALLIDMVPAGLITMFLLRCELADLLRPPLLVARFDLAVPYLVMAGVTVLYTGVWELTNGSSLGKSLMHARVTDMQGQRLSPRATLIRLAFKAVVLYVPVLAMFNLLNNAGQGLGDRAIGAVVVTEQEQPQEPRT